MSKITSITGQGFHLPGNSVNTDVIIPARFLTCVTFDALGPSVFADARAACAQKGEVHPFDRSENQGRAILLVDADFGSGSSREHAPQAIMRWGVRCIIGISFAEIFAGNSTAIGLPCVRVEPADHAALVAAMADEGSFVVNLELKTVTYQPLERKPATTVPCKMPEGDLKALTEGRWDSVATLLEAGDRIEETERRQAPIPAPVNLPAAA